MANGNSDVKLLPGQVKVEAWDLCVDSEDRRKSTIGFRRALVHDFEDGLTVNWGGDYPGGVTLNGNKVRVVGILELTPGTFPEATAAPAPGGRKATRGGTELTFKAVPKVAERAMTAAIAETYFGKGPIDVGAALMKLAVEIESLKKGKP